MTPSEILDRLHELKNDAIYLTRTLTKLNDCIVANIAYEIQSTADEADDLSDNITSLIDAIEDDL